MSKTRYTLSADDLIQVALMTKRNSEAFLDGLNASGAAKQLDVLVGGTGASAFLDQKLVYYDAEQKRLRSSFRGVAETVIPALPTNLLRVGDAAGGGLTGTYPNPALPTDLVRDGDAAGGDLRGTYPNPTIGLNKVKAENLFPPLGNNTDVLTLVGGQLAWAAASAGGGGATTVFLTPTNVNFNGLANANYTISIQAGGGTSGKSAGYDNGKATGGPGGDGAGVRFIINAGASGVIAVLVGGPGQTSIISTSAGSVTVTAGGNGTDATASQYDNEPPNYSMGAGAAGTNGSHQTTGSIFILSTGGSVLGTYGKGGVALEIPGDLGGLEYGPNYPGANGAAILSISI